MLAPEIGPLNSGQFIFTVSVDADLIRDKPITTLLEGAVDSINGLLISAEAICQRAGSSRGHNADV